MISKDSIESAYCFLHQKYRVYKFSNNETQRDDIEFAIASYVEEMNKELYAQLEKNFFVTIQLLMLICKRL